MRRASTSALEKHKISDFFFSVLAEKHPPQKKVKKPAGHRKFYFYMYSPEHDRECEAVKVIVMTCYSSKAASTLRQRNLKSRFISTVWHTVHTNPTRKWSFSKSLFNQSNFKMPAFHFRVVVKHFENGDFRKQWRRNNHVAPLTEFSSNTNPK